MGGGTREALRHTQREERGGDTSWRPPAYSLLRTTVLAVADPGFLERGGRGGEWPKATRGVGRGEGVSPSPLEWGLGRGCAPPQKNFEI